MAAIPFVATSGCTWQQLQPGGLLEDLLEEQRALGAAGDQPGQQLRRAGLPVDPRDRAVLGGGHVQAEDLALSVGVDTGRDQRVDVDDAAALAGLLGQRVDLDEGVGAWSRGRLRKAIAVAVVDVFVVDLAVLGTAGGVGLVDEADRRQERHGERRTGRELPFQARRLEERGRLDPGVPQPRSGQALRSVWTARATLSTVSMPSPIVPLPCESTVIV